MVRLRSAGLGGIFGKDGVEGGDEKIGVGLREDQRWPELDDVVMGAVGAGEDAAIAQAVDDVRSLLRRGCARFAIDDKVYAEEEARAADVPNQPVLFLQCFQPRNQVAPNLQCVFLKVLVFEYIQNRKASSARDGITPEGAEEFHAVVEVGGDFAGGDDGR